MRRWKIAIALRAIPVPKRLRGFLAARPQDITALTRIFLTETERLLCGLAGPPRDVGEIKVSGTFFSA
jgi:hypothetical protein